MTKMKGFWSFLLPFLIGAATCWAIIVGRVFVLSQMPVATEYNQGCLYEMRASLMDYDNMSGAVPLRARLDIDSPKLKNLLEPGEYYFLNQIEKGQDPSDVPLVWTPMRVNNKLQGYSVMAWNGEVKDMTTDQFVTFLLSALSTSQNPSVQSYRFDGEAWVNTTSPLNPWHFLSGRIERRKGTKSTAASSTTLLGVNLMRKTGTPTLRAFNPLKLWEGGKPVSPQSTHRNRPGTAPNWPIPPTPTKTTPHASGK